MGMGLGPIPWSAILEWCLWHSLARDVAQHAIDVIRLVDADTLRRERMRNKLKK